MLTSKKITWLFISLFAVSPALAQSWMKSVVRGSGKITATGTQTVRNLSADIMKKAAVSAGTTDIIKQAVTRNALNGVSGQANPQVRNMAQDKDGRYAIRTATNPVRTGFRNQWNYREYTPPPDFSKKLDKSALQNKQAEKVTSFGQEDFRRFYSDEHMFPAVVGDPYEKARHEQFRRWRERINGKAPSVAKNSFETNLQRETNAPTTLLSTQEKREFETTVTAAQQMAGKPLMRRPYDARRAETVANFKDELEEYGFDEVVDESNSVAYKQALTYASFDPANYLDNFAIYELPFHPNVKQMNVLVVSDDEIFAGLLNKGAKKDDRVHVQVFPSGNEATYHLSKFPDKYDIILTDNYMPYGTGIDVAQYVQAQKLKAYVVLASKSAYDKGQLFLTGFDGSFSVFHNKVDTEELLFESYLPYQPAANVFAYLSNIIGNGGHAFVKGQARPVAAKPVQESETAYFHRLTRQADEYPTLQVPRSEPVAPAKENTPAVQEEKPAPAAPSLVAMFHRDDLWEAPSWLSYETEYSESRPQKKEVSTVYKPSRKALEADSKDKGIPEEIYTTKTTEELQVMLDQFDRALQKHDDVVSWSLTGRNAKYIAGENAHLPPFIRDNFIPESERYTELWNEKISYMRILVVDDPGSWVNLFTKEALYDSRLKVTHASGGYSAVDLLTKNPQAFDIVMANETISFGSGTYLSMWMWSNNVNIPFVSISNASALAEAWHAYNIVGKISMDHSNRELFNYASNIVATGKAYPNR